MSNVFVTGKKLEVSGTQLVLWLTTTGDVYVEGVHGQMDGSISYQTTKHAWVNLPVNELFGHIQYLTDWSFGDGGTMLLISPCYPDAVTRKATNGYVIVLGTWKGKTRVRRQGSRFIITAVALPKCIKIYGNDVVVDNFLKKGMNAKKTIEAAKLLGFEMYETGDGYQHMTVIYCR